MGGAARRPVTLLILDGFGIAPASEGNAVALAKTPVWDRLWRRFPHAELAASGEAVGLPAGQQGNSEVGHLTIGAGRVVLQALPRISRAVETGELYSNPVLAPALEQLAERGGTLHLVGLISPGGVHSHQAHGVAVTHMAARMGVAKIRVHAITDGRDEPAESGAQFLEQFCAAMAPRAVISTLGGRYWGMDRDKRWDRVERWCRVMIGREGTVVADPVQHLRQQYALGITDEFVEPVLVGADDGDARSPWQERDLVVCFNFRPDRMRQLVHVLVDENFDSFNLSFERPAVVTFTEYEDNLPVQVAFPSSPVRHTLVEEISAAGMQQFHVAETEKYAHVTYFLNGGAEEPVPGETRVLIPSSRVATYDLAPEMSADGITETLLEAISQGKYQFLVANFANPDMVGHTGKLAETIRAVEVVDACLGRIQAAVEKAGGVLVITADHGNAEHMLGPEGEPVTSHTTNPVPLVIAGAGETGVEAAELSEVAPLVLQLLELPVPEEMLGAREETAARST